MHYKVKEIFYSIQGEGLWTGTPAVFVRLSGCNLNCDFCDTDYKGGENMTPAAILQQAEEKGGACGVVVLTGGEPLLQDPLPLLDMLQGAGYRVHLETNGTLCVDNLGRFDWITVSPKPGAPLHSTLVWAADEIKLLCGTSDWQDDVKYFISDWADILMITKPDLRLMPLDTGGENGVEENLNMAINYCLEHPRFKLCIQTHKYIGVK